MTPVLIMYLVFQVFLASLPVIAYILLGRERVIENASWGGHGIGGWLVIPGFILGCLFVKAFTTDVDK